MNENLDIEDDNNEITENEDPINSDETDSEIQEDTTTVQTNFSLSRRQILLGGGSAIFALAATLGGGRPQNVAGGTIPPQSPTWTPTATETNTAIPTATASATPENTETPTPTTTPELSKLEALKKYITRLQENLAFGYLELILPLIPNPLNPNKEEIDWDATLAADEFWLRSENYFGDKLPTTVAITLNKDIPTALIGGAGNGPQPIGIRRIDDFEEKGWALLEKTNGYSYYGATLNNVLNPFAIDALAAIKAGTSTLIKEESSTTTLDYEFVNGREMQGIVGKLMRNYPLLRHKVVVSMTDGYVSPSLLFDNLQAAKTESTQSVTSIIDEPSPLIKFSPEFSVHNAFTQSVLKGKGTFSGFPGLLGPLANVEVVATIGENPRSGITKIIEDRLNKNELNIDLPLTFVNIPFDIPVGVVRLNVRGTQFSLYDKEFLQMLKNLNIVAIWSLGNETKFFDVADKAHGLNVNDSETVQLFQDTILVATQGLVIDNSLYINPDHGLPDKKDRILEEATFVSPGRFPALSFCTYHIADSTVDLSSVAPALSGFRHGLLTTDLNISGSSIAVTCVAAQLAAYSMALLTSPQNKNIRAYEVLRKLKEIMPRKGVPVYGEPNTERNLRVVNNELLIDILRKASDSPPPQGNTFLPTIGT